MIELALACVVGALYGIALYLMLGQSIIRLVIGLAILSHAANLLIFTAAGMTKGRSPIVGGAASAAAEFADPLPQALILTAIVISFAVLGFALVLARRACLGVGSDDVERLRGSEA